GNYVVYYVVTYVVCVMKSEKWQYIGANITKTPYKPVNYRPAETEDSGKRASTVSIRNRLHNWAMP
ncbi:MAG: hypothetical protein ACP5D1_13030, partial [Bacteroidales bacterium]